jgi:excisionase family DNA binding protein
MMSGKVDTMFDKLLRKREVAQMWACSLRTVEREANEGRLTRIRVRGGVRFRESEVLGRINGGKS